MRDKSRISGWRTLAPGAWGLSPTFRVFLFLGGLLGVMAFLLYNEYVIQTFRDQERDRAKLYAKLYGLALSDAMPSELSGDIWGTVILDEEGLSFPLIVTDHRGRVINWRGPGLPPPVLEPELRTPEMMHEVRRIRDEMDAVNLPLTTSWSKEAPVRVCRFGESVVILDPANYAAAWSGVALPAETDLAAARQVEAIVGGWTAAGNEPEPLTQLSTLGTHHLVRERFDFAIARQGQVVAWGGPSLPAFGPDADASAAQQLYNRVAADSEPFVFQVHNELVIHFGDTEMISRISMAPFVTIGVLMLFVMIGWVGSRNIRRSEQRSIWVGMAKETAHQLGTPLSSLSGWLELMSLRVRSLAEAPQQDAEALASVEQAVSEMQNDMGRLNQIASRFSQIGSVPELKAGDVNDVIRDTVAYFEGRGSQFGRHHFEAHLGDVPDVPHNAELMGWAFENLFKNAIDAMVQQEGCIRATSQYDEERQCVRILVEDDGRGIDAENLARVFQPGFSTKKRGWGLGLAFVRRIVEEYHGGQIHIPRSAPDVGTTFEINLPVKDATTT